MADHASEEEQIEAIRRWWRENGRGIIAGILIGLAALGGWSGWNWYHSEQALAASDIYEDVVSALEQGEYAAVREQASTLRDEYGSTTYAGLGALAAARAAVEQDDLASAREWLRWTVDEASGVELATVARARLARVIAAQNEPEEALALLDADVPAAFEGLYAEIRGDVLRQQGEREAAAEAYRQALEAQGPVADRQLIERKLNRVGGDATDLGNGAAAAATAS